MFNKNNDGYCHVRIKDKKLFIRAKMRSAYNQEDLYELVERAIRNEIAKLKKEKTL